VEGGDRYGASDLEPVLGDHGCRPCSPADIEQVGMDDEDAQALRAEGFDPDAPAVVAAIDMVRWELSRLLGLQR